MLVCPSCDKPTRVGIKQEGDKKVRVCKKCGKEIISDNPEKKETVKKEEKKETKKKTTKKSTKSKSESKK